MDPDPKMSLIFPDFFLNYCPYDKSVPNLSRIWDNFLLNKDPAWKYIHYIKDSSSKTKDIVIPDIKNYLIILQGSLPETLSFLS